MDSGAVLRYCRRRAGLSQRALAARAGVPQSAVGRIEAGMVMPRVDTLRRLLDKCGFTLEVREAPRLDRTVIRALLALSPRERLELAAAEATNLDRLLRR